MMHRWMDRSAEAESARCLSLTRGLGGESRAVRMCSQLFGGEIGERQEFVLVLGQGCSPPKTGGPERSEVVGIE